MASEKEWISISDLMSVLMMVFLFIAILFMLKVKDDSRQLENQHEAMKAVAETYDDTKNALREELLATFADDLERWDAAVLADGTIRFNHPQALFAVGKSELSNRFKAILDNFFPRYVAVLSSPQWRDDIDEIRIEGHTSSDWQGAGDVGQRYIRNAQLSQERAFAVLRYAYLLPAVGTERDWLRGLLRANGLSNAKPVLVDGVEDPQQSRRVEFSAKTRADDKIYDILQHSRANLAPSF